VRAKDLPPPLPEAGLEAAPLVRDREPARAADTALH
jgi:hypothetical protein